MQDSLEALPSSTLGLPFDWQKFVPRATWATVALRKELAAPVVDLVAREPQCETCWPV